MSMVKLSIDGHEVQAREGTLVLRAARDAGIQIPSLCWHRKLTPTGACRLCLVKIEGTRGLVTSCSMVVREDLHILPEIARRKGRPIGADGSASEVFDEIARVAPIMAGIDYSRLEAGGIQWPCPSRDHPGTPTLLLKRFNTTDGLARLNPVDYAPQSEQADAEYPFLLNTARILYQYDSSTMPRRSPPFVEYANQAYLLMHPADADRLGLTDGEMVRITSRRGSIQAPLRRSREVTVGELFMPFHFAEAPVNRLTRDELDPYSKIAPFKLSACRVER